MAVTMGRESARGRQLHGEVKDRKRSQGKEAQHRSSMMAVFSREGIERRCTVSKKEATRQGKGQEGR
jgi:hypothetical protein